MFRADLPGDFFGEGKFVVRSFLKPDGKRMKFAAGEGGGEGCDGAGVDSPAEKDADVDIAAELVTDGFPQEFAGCFCGLIESTGANRIVFDGQIPEVFGVSACGGPCDHLAGFQFSNSGISR